MIIGRRYRQPTGPSKQGVPDEASIGTGETNLPRATVFPTGPDTQGVADAASIGTGETNLPHAMVFGRHIHPTGPDTQGVARAASIGTEAPYMQSESMSDVTTAHFSEAPSSSTDYVIPTHAPAIAVGSGGTPSLTSDAPGYGSGESSYDAPAFLIGNDFTENDPPHHGSRDLAPSDEHVQNDFKADVT